MGAENASHSPSILDKYALLQQISSQLYGEATLYRKKELNYDYLAVLNRLILSEMSQQLIQEL